MFRRLAERFHSRIQSRPISTHLATSLTLWGIGDYAAQCIEAEKLILSAKDFHLARFASTVAFAGIFVAPLGHFWYENLGKITAVVLKRTGFASSTRNVLIGKVALDSFAFGPVYLAAFFAFMTKALGGAEADVWEKLEKDFASTFAAQMMFWPPIQLLNFWKTPVRYQLLVVNCVCIVDSTFLSWARANDQWFGKLIGRQNKEEND
jgi:protein Mpv17